MDFAVTFGKIALVQSPHAREVRIQRPDQACRQHGHAITRAFAIAHRDLVAFEIDILDAQPQSLQEAHPRAVQKTDNQPARAFQLREQCSYFVFPEHDRKVLRPLGAHHAIQPRQIDLQHLAVKKQQRRQGLILCRGRHTTGSGEVRQERLDLRAAHLPGMFLAVKENEAANPLQISVFRAHAVVFNAQSVAYLVEQTRCRHGVPWWLRYCTNVQVPIPVDVVEESAT